MYPHKLFIIYTYTNIYHLSKFILQVLICASVTWVIIDVCNGLSSVRHQAIARPAMSYCQLHHFEHTLEKNVNQNWKYYFKTIHSKVLASWYLSFCLSDEINMPHKFNMKIGSKILHNECLDWAHPIQFYSTRARWLFSRFLILASKAVQYGKVVRRTASFGTHHWSPTQAQTLFSDAWPSARACIVTIT